MNSNAAHGAGMPSGIHIAIVVYGSVYASLLARITLANLAAMVREIPEELRAKSLVRIVTTRADVPTISSSRALQVLRKAIAVEIVEGAQLSGHEKHGDYGPMVETQRLIVVEAARSNAAIFFVGPDLIFNQGAFALFVDRLRSGYRLIVGPGPRIKRDAARPFLEQQIASSTDGTFALRPEDQVDLLFRYWHHINDKFMLESDEGIWWKAYVCHRPRPGDVFFRFIQGPTFVAWPRHRQDDFDGFIDHQLPDLCCETWREIYVVPDGHECLPLDMTEDTRPEIMELSDFPSVFLLRELFDHGAVKDLKLRYAFRTSYVHRRHADAKLMALCERRLTRIVDPLILLAMAERRINRTFGRLAGRLFRLFCIWNTNTLSFLLSPFAGRLSQRWKNTFPLGSSADLNGPANAATAKS